MQHGQVLLAERMGLTRVKYSDGNIVIIRVRPRCSERGQHGFSVADVRLVEGDLGRWASCEVVAIRWPNIQNPNTSRVLSACY